MDFLRFCVWVNGESVEENANLVIRLLIRRPECLGPALRGEGEGLKSAVMSGEKMHSYSTVKGSEKRFRNRTKFQTGRNGETLRHFPYFLEV